MSDDNGNNINDIKNKDQIFWKQKWIEGSTHFHNQDFNPLLTGHYPSIAKNHHKVFMPLCGKSNDIFYFAERDLSVLGVELSEVAVHDFFKDNNLKFEVEKNTHYKIHKTQNITILLGNLFDIGKQELKDINFIYDRASLIALPPTLRELYYTILKEKFERGTEILLLAFEYDDQYGDKLIEGPPHSVTEKEIQKNLGEYFKITSLERSDFKIKSQKLLDQGLSDAIETVYYLEKIK